MCESVIVNSSYYHFRHYFWTLWVLRVQQRHYWSKQVSSSGKLFGFFKFLLSGSEMATLISCMLYFIQTNQFLERHAPWQLVKDPTKQEHLQTVLLIALESIRLCTCLLYPVIPESATAILQRIGIIGSSSVEWSPGQIDVKCWLANEDIERLRVAIRNVVIGGKPLFNKCL